jgi:hypothetical protein
VPDRPAPPVPPVLIDENAIEREVQQARFMWSRGGRGLSGRALADKEAALREQLRRQQISRGRRS